MKLYDYKTLSEDEQFNAVWNDGTYIDTFIHGNIKINLYAINNFFVEIYYDAVLNKIIDKKHFKHGELLDKYLCRFTL
jgi:hypothetical protein